MIAQTLRAAKKELANTSMLLAKRRTSVTLDSKGYPIYKGKPLLPFVFRNYQERDYLKFRSMKQAKLFLMYPRRSGKDSFCWALCVTEALTVPGNYCYVLPDREQAGRVIWRGAMIDKHTKKAIRFLDMIPPELIKKKNDQLKTIELVNGSVIYLIGANRPNSLRGVNLTGTIFSEFAFCPTDDAYLIVLPVIAESKGWMVLNTTPNGFNFAWSLFKKLKYDKDWHAVIETVETLKDEKGNRYISDEDIERAVGDGNMPEGLVRQEFYCEPMLNQDELYYAFDIELMKTSGRLGPIEPDRHLHMHFVFDLGSDATPIIGFQVSTSGKIFIVFFHTPTEDVKTYGWYYNLVTSYVNSNSLIMGKIILPHDSVKRQVNESSVSNAYTDFRKLGADVVKLKRVGNKDSLINLSKIYLARTHINDKCEYLIEALSNYKRDYDKKLNTFHSKPRHDWASHPADCYQYLAQAVEEGQLAISRNQEIYYK